MIVLLLLSKKHTHTQRCFQPQMFTFIELVHVMKLVPAASVQGGSRTFSWFYQLIICVCLNQGSATFLMMSAV